MGLLMYGIMRLIYGQQATSIVTTESAVGAIGTVTTAIGREGTGEVDLTLRGQNRTFLARSADAKPIARGRRVEVVHTAGSQLVVREMREVDAANAPVSA
jgi:membrane-bound ClpP family serine protease